MRRTLSVVLGVVVLAGGSVFGHHSYAEFLVDQTVSIEGELEDVAYANPHVVLTVRTADSARYTAVWRSAYQLSRTGVTSSTLRVGDHIVVSGSPSRDAEMRGLSLLREIRRPADGWRWSRN
jgi:Family of unknown function (DUF6152)